MRRLAKSDEDLFRESTMTFGEHLEELRGSLIRAIVGLVLGFAIGLLIGRQVTHFIQDPLVQALTAYYENQAEVAVRELVEEEIQAGRAHPERADELARMIKTQRLIFEQVFVEPRELLAQLAHRLPEMAPNAPPPPEGGDLTREDLISVKIWRPVEHDERLRVQSLGVVEPFTVYIKVSLLVGAVLASPWIFYQAWQFVAAGLYRHERRYIHVFLPFSVALFLLGASTAFFFVFEPVLNFLLSFNAWLGIAPDPRINEWLSFVLFLPVGFGIAFQLPLVMLFLERIQIFSVEVYLAQWRMAILVICLISMMLTPADPYSMILLAIPLTFLYFSGILLCRLMPRSRSPFDLPED